MLDKLKEIWEQVSLWFEVRSSREKKLISSVLVVISLLICVAVIASAASGLASKRSQIVVKEKQLKGLKRLSVDYLAQKKKNQVLERALKNNHTSLFSLLQSSATQLELTLSDLAERKQVLPGEKVLEVSVGVNFKKVSIDRLTAFIKAVESSKPKGLVKVTKLKVKTRYDIPDLLDVQLTVSTWKEA